MGEFIGGYMVLSFALLIYGVVVFFFPLIVISRLGKIVKSLEEIITLIAFNRK